MACKTKKENIYKKFLFQLEYSTKMSSLQIIDFVCHPCFWIGENNKAYILHCVKGNTTYLKCKLSTSEKCLGKSKTGWRSN